MSLLESGIKQIEKDLAALPDGTKGAFVATVNSKGVLTLSLATRINDSWSLSAGLQGKLEKTMPDAYVGIKKSW